ncbi:MAG: dTDP-6-deoxy-L-hexose 3-O-methyltransferase [Pseudomonadales bacterium]|nr:dTDP-6-deoxy-L-hexose 3-O-methyltransferase [Pseudomonadales bacterium]
MTDKMVQQQSFKIETTASESQLANRESLIDLFDSAPLGKEDLLFNLGLFTRSTLLVKYLVMNDLYQRVKHLPGQLLEFGVWWGQNLVLLENLRAIHEPFNKQRIIVGFDTFEGYTAPSKNDRNSDVWQAESYATGKEYMSFLTKLLQIHEGSNVLGHIQGNHRLVAGNVCETAPEYFKEHPEAMVALAYFDMGLYEPTLAAMQAIKPHLMPGSVLLLDEFTWEESPGEAIAFKETFNDTPYKIEKSELYPSKAIVTIV